MRVRDTRVAQTRPDLSVSSGLQLSQGNAVFGYASVTESSQEPHQLRQRSASIGILYRHPILNRTAKATVTIAEST